MEDVIKQKLEKAKQNVKLAFVNGFVQGGSEESKRKIRLRTVQFMESISANHYDLIDFESPSIKHFDGMIAAMYKEMALKFIEKGVYELDEIVDRWLLESLNYIRRR